MTTLYGPPRSKTYTTSWDITSSQPFVRAVTALCRAIVSLDRLVGHRVMQPSGIGVLHASDRAAAAAKLDTAIGSLRSLLSG